MEKEFTLKKILKLDILPMFCIIFICLIPFLALIHFLPKMRSFIVSFGLCAFVISLFCKDVSIRFDSEYVIFDINAKISKYKKSDVLGFYSFDYPKAYRNSTVSICFYFQDGKKLELSDYISKYDEEKQAMLSSFIKIAQREFAFKKVSSNRLRKFIRFGYLWYSR